MFKEEVTFNTTNVTSLDWNSYPILRFEECPEVTPVVVQRLDQRSTGAGEEVMAAAAGCDRECVLRCDGRADAGVSVDAEAGLGGAKTRVTPPLSLVTAR